MTTPAVLSFEIDPDIRQAHTLPGEVYTSAAWFERHRRMFTRTWHMLPQDEQPRALAELEPWTFLPGCLDEPLLLTHDGTRLRCMSNVCTHRGNVMIERRCVARSIRCGYHGRRFGLDGKLVAAPGFEGAPAFPGPADHLPSVSVHAWSRWVFAALAPEHTFDALFAPLVELTTGLAWPDLEYDPARSRQFDVRAPWALYVDNYLEGLHIAYVHPGLGRTLERTEYRTELHPLGVLQTGIARPGEPTLPLPTGHRDHGRSVAAYYFWVFPATMVNVYPWGVSVNVVQPVGPNHTRVVFLTYAWDRTLYDRGAGAALAEVEYEDEQVVESVARGVASACYQRGRYSPAHETGVHHFHRLLCRFLQS